MVEEYIARALANEPGFSMEQFEQALPAWFETGADERSALAFDLLSNMADFMCFKDMMLAAKKGGNPAMELVSQGMQFTESQRDAASYLAELKAILDEGEDLWTLRNS